MDVQDPSSYSISQDVRYLRDNFNSLKVAIDKVLDDHEDRLRDLQLQVTDLNNQKFLIIGAGAVIGWLGSLVLRMFVK